MPLRLSARRMSSIPSFSDQLGSQRYLAGSIWLTAPASYLQEVRSAIRSAHAFLMHADTQSEPLKSGDRRRCVIVCLIGLALHRVAELSERRRDKHSALLRAGTAQGGSRPLGTSDRSV